MSKHVRTSRKRKLPIAALLAATVCLAAGLAACGCSSEKPAEQTTDPEPVIFTDSAGREVELPGKIDRIATSGALAQQVLLTVAPEKLVGLSTELSDDELKYFGQDLAELPVYGQFFGKGGTFNKEAVGAANPQVVIDIGETKQGIVEDLDSLQEQIGIPCIHLSASLDSYDQVYAQLGKLLGVEERAEKLGSWCADAYAETCSIMAEIPESDRVRTMYLSGDDGQQTIARGSYFATVLDMVADNVAVDETGTGSMGMEISLKSIAVIDPDLILFSPTSIYDSVADDAAWSSLTAVAAGNYYRVPGCPYNWIEYPPSVNQVLGIQWLPRLLYPDRYDDDMQDVVTDYYRTFYQYELTDDEYHELVGTADEAA